MEDVKIIFMSTPEFAVPIFKGLVEHYHVVAVVTQPDKCVGRKQIMMSSPIKEASALYNIPVLQPKNIKEEYQMVLDFHPDLIITCAYGQILPAAILEYPKYGCINVHASLLPKLRGGAPIHHAIIDGYQKTGVTIMYMSLKMDAGDILTQAETAISDQDTLESLSKRLSEMGKMLLLKTLPDLLAGKLEAKAQDESEVTYGYNITREEEKIDFNWSKEKIDCLVRGLYPHPGAYTTLDGKIMKVYNVRLGHREYFSMPNGTIADFEKDGFCVVAGGEEIIITDIAIEGKKRCLVKDYLNGVDKEKLRGKILK